MLTFQILVHLPLPVCNIIEIGIKIIKSSVFFLKGCHVQCIVSHVHFPNHKEKHYKLHTIYNFFYQEVRQFALSQNLRCVHYTVVQLKSKCNFVCLSKCIQKQFYPTKLHYSTYSAKYMIKHSVYIEDSHKPVNLQSQSQAHINEGDCCQEGYPI